MKYFYLSLLIFHVKVALQSLLVQNNRSTKANEVLSIPYFLINLDLFLINQHTDLLLQKSKKLTLQA